MMRTGQNQHDIHGKNITSLITFKEWITLEQYVNQNSNVYIPASGEKEIYTCGARCRARCSIKHDFLHHACKHCDIPLSTVIAIAGAYPHAVKEEDCVGRLPLHYATKSGASPHVIRYLVAQYPDAVIQQDRNGMTPLHLACKYFHKTYKGNRDDACLNYCLCKEDWTKYVSEQLNIVIKTFLDAAPKSLLLEDLDGMSALEYAIVEEADCATVSMMQIACEKVRETKMSSETRYLTTSAHESIMTGAIRGRIKTMSMMQIAREKIRKTKTSSETYHLTTSVHDNMMTEAIRDAQSICVNVAA